MQSEQAMLGGPSLSRALRMGVTPTLLMKYVVNVCAAVHEEYTTALFRARHVLVPFLIKKGLLYMHFISLFSVQT